MDLRYATSPEHVPGMDTDALRRRFLVQDLFVDDEVASVYTHHDRVVLLGATPVSGPITLPTFAEIRSEFFFEHREGGIVGGFFTATEGSAVAVVASLVLAFLYRAISVKDLPRILYSAARTSSVVIFLIGVSSIMSFVMSFTRMPQLIAEGLFGWTDSKVVVLLVMMVVLLIIGIPLDATPAVLIFTPIFLPVAVQYGIDPVQFGIMLTFNLCIAIISPPSAPVLFVGAQVAGVRIEPVIRHLMPFFLALVAVLFLVTFVPALSLWLPGLFGLL